MVVIATDGYTQGLLEGLDAAVRPTRGQVIATAPLPEQPFPRPHYTYDGYVYWHQLEDRRLVLGGFRDRTLEDEWTHEEATTALIQGALDAFARELVGEVEVVKLRGDLRLDGGSSAARRSGSRRGACLGLVRLLGPRQRDGTCLRRPRGPRDPRRDVTATRHVRSGADPLVAAVPYRLVAGPG
jgi:hypothetical protein